MQGVQPVTATFRGPIPWPHACTLPARKNNRGRGLMAKQIGYAVVGAGPLVERALLPAFARAGGETRLAAIVSADRTRADALAQEHRVTGYHYDEFRQSLQREDVQAVYLTLPNSLHCDYRNHRRILVVDGRVGFTGGSGVSGQWMGNGRVEHHWRDTD